LLDTYEKERRPVGAFTAEPVYMCYVTREAKYLITDDLPPLENDLNIELAIAIIPRPSFPTPATMAARTKTRANRKASPDSALRICGWSSTSRRSIYSGRTSCF
jgi:hypothetical protein